MRRGILYCLVGAAGSGKTSLGARLLELFPGSLRRNISVTSRQPRDGEVHGQNYHFISEQDFQQRIEQDLFFEWEKTHGNYYGTLKSSIEQALEDGVDLLLDIDIRGSLSLQKAFPRNTTIVFIAPPSHQVLIERLQGRGVMSEQELKTRLETCEREYRTVLESYESNEAPTHLLVNDDFEKALEMLGTILISERQRFHLQTRKDLEELFKK